MAARIPLVEQATPVEWLRRRRRSVCSKFPLVRLVPGRDDFAMLVAELLRVGVVQAVMMGAELERDTPDL